MSLRLMHNYTFHKSFLQYTCTVEEMNAPNPFLLAQHGGLQPAQIFVPDGSCSEPLLT